MSSFCFFPLRGFSSHMDQISPQIKNKVLSRGGVRPVSPQSLSVQMEAITTPCVVYSPGIIITIIIIFKGLQYLGIGSLFILYQII